MDASRKVQANRRLQKQRRQRYITALDRTYKRVATTEVFNSDRFPKRSASKIEDSILQVRSSIKKGSTDRLDQDDNDGRSYPRNLVLLIIKVYLKGTNRDLLIAR
jgi:hypothetical protein